MRKICVVTGTRAEYGILYWVMKEILKTPELELQLVVTGMHLSPEFGFTYNNIVNDGFNIDAKVEMLLSSDSPVGTSKSIGIGILGFSDAFDRLKPDLILVVGDRFEILAAVQVALVANIPVAHIAGGDITEGAFDDAIRHSITKMSHLHFVTNEESARRVNQMGEDPSYIFEVGNPGLDHIRRNSLLSLEMLQRELGFVFRRKNILLTYHPVTLAYKENESHLRQIFLALDKFGDEVGVLITKPNADPCGREFIRMINEYSKLRSNVKVFDSLGQLRYLSTIANVDAVVGNSSSGLYEVPSFNKPTVNIGDRQKGRLQAISVINCPPVAEEIFESITIALNSKYHDIVNPYGDGKSSQRIVKVLREISSYKELLHKRFYEV